MTKRVQPKRWLTGLLCCLLGLIVMAALSACGSDTRPTATTSPETDREALVALYNATDGPNWHNNQNWLSDAPIGEWYGVATKEGRVARLFLNRNGLSGEIPPELGNLTKLVWLYLDRNKLSGEIPGELDNLFHLEDTILAHNELSGEIPPELGDLANLEFLGLNDNKLNGEIPPELGNLANLERLMIDGNQLSGCIPFPLNQFHSGITDLGDLPHC